MLIQVRYKSIRQAGVLYRLLQMLMVTGALFLIKYGIADIRQVTGDSMYPALHEGQYVIIWRLAYGIALPFQNTYLVRWQKPKKDDMVCYAVNGRYVIKRCVATGGTQLGFPVTPKKNCKHMQRCISAAGVFRLRRYSFRTLEVFCRPTGVKYRVILFWRLGIMQLIPMILVIMGLSLSIAFMVNWYGNK